MFHKAVNLTFQKGTAFDVLFQDGITKRYDISNLFDKYPQLKALPFTFLWQTQFQRQEQNADYRKKNFPT